MTSESLILQTKMEYFKRMHVEKLNFFSLMVMPYTKYKFMDQQMIYILTAKELEREDLFKASSKSTTSIGLAVPNPVSFTIELRTTLPLF